MSNESLSPLEQMNQLLSEKEQTIDRKLTELKEYHAELKNFENELLVKANEIKVAQDKLEEEKKLLDKRWEELKAHEKKLESSMSDVLAEKVRLEQRNVLNLDKMLEDDEILGVSQKTSSEFDLKALREAVGISTSKSSTEDSKDMVEAKKEQEETQKLEKESESIMAISQGATNNIPEVFQNLAIEIKKSYPKWTKLELLPERYCLEIGDKEIRFFDTDEKYLVPRVEIIVFRKNARADKRLLNNIAGIERIAPDWSITTEDNQLVCTMHFTAETKPAVVLKKCSDFIKNHLM